MQKFFSTYMLWIGRVGGLLTVVGNCILSYMWHNVWT